MPSFASLPDELKLEILQRFFNETDNGGAQRSISHDSTFKNYKISVSFCSQRGGKVQPPTSDHSRLEICLHLPSTYPVIFISHSFLAMALPIFIKATTPELLMLKLQTCNPSSTSPRSVFISTQILLTILEQIKHIKLSTDQLLPTVSQVPNLHDVLPSLRTITLVDQAPLVWSRFVSSTYTASLEHQHILSSRIVKDIFQTPIMAAICGPNTRRLLTEQEVQGLEGQLLFPGDLKALCRYVDIVNEDGQLPPIEVRRVVTVVCCEEAREGRRREVFLDLTIDVRRVRVIAVCVRGGDESVDGSVFGVRC